MGILITVSVIPFAIGVYKDARKSLNDLQLHDKEIKHKKEAEASRLQQLESASKPGHR